MVSIPWMASILDNTYLFFWYKIGICVTFGVYNNPKDVSVQTELASYIFPKLANGHIPSRGMVGV